jgi:hypothetical protein
MNGAFYSSSIQVLVDQASEAILGHLAKHNPFALDALQRNAWLNQIDLAQSQFGGLDGWIAFEFAIPRMGKRADLVLITAGIIFVIEFKVGSDRFDAAALDQVVDYALDLKNSRVTSLARVDVVGPSRGEPLELVHLGVRVTFRLVVVLNPIDQELLDALLGKVRILLIDMPHGLVEIQRSEHRPEEFALSGIEAYIHQQTVPQFAQHIQPG